MAANVEAMVREGTNALKAGRKEEARVLLMKAVEIDEMNEDAWLWLSAVVESEEDQQTCLENVLAINPNNQRASQGLRYLQQKQAGIVPEARPAAPPPPPPPPAAARPAPPPPTAPATSTSVEWGAPAEDPAPVTTPPRAPDLSEEDYDNWVSTLNLPTASRTGPTAVSATPFIDDEDDVSPFDDPTFDLEPDVSIARPAGPSKGTTPKGSKAPVPALEEDELRPQSQRGGLKLPQMPGFGQRAKKTPEATPEPEVIEPFFPGIPEEVRATRLPGTQERLSILLVIVLVLVLAAIVAVSILLFQALTVA